MKKLLSISILLFSLTLLSHTNSYAQHNKLGAGIVYGEAAESAGIQATGVFRVSQQIEFAPDVTIYFPDDEDTGLDSFWAVNLNGHYIFTMEDEYHLYGLGGLNIASIDPVIGDSDSELGINLGVGGEYHLENFSLYSELKYVIGDLDQVVLGVGARFPLN